MISHFPRNEGDKLYLMGKLEIVIARQIVHKVVLASIWLERVYECHLTQDGLVKGISLLYGYKEFR